MFTINHFDIMVVGSSWPWSYGSWIYNYLVRISIRATGVW